MSKIRREEKETTHCELCLIHNSKSCLPHPLVIIPENILVHIFVKYQQLIQHHIKLEILN
jgi:hypothetical protein